MVRGVFALLLVVFLIESCTKTEVNTRQNFDFGWKFLADDLPRTEEPTFDDTAWRTVDLPHDWSIEGRFSKDNPSFSRGGWLPTGKVTYRKTFTVPASEQGRRYVIYFDGAYRNSKVYLNGHLLGERPLGYIAFHYDLTPYLKYGDKNVLTVKLDNSSQPGARWYTGTGIYRHVYLISTNPVYVPIWGNYIVANDFDDKKALVKIQTDIRNDSESNETLTLRHTAFSRSGKKVAEIAEKFEVQAESKTRVNMVLEIPNPELWSPEHPHRYTIKTEILKDRTVLYAEQNKTGIRTLEFDKDFGFKLNSKPTKIKGVCLHHAGGPLGAAIYRRTTERQLEKLREMGCNAIRTAHNPFSEEFLDVCDSMGFLVLNEMFDEWEHPKSPSTVQDGKKIRIPVDYYAKHFNEWSYRDLTDFVLSTRNHPSVFMWSIGNEIEQMRHPEGEAIGKRLAAIVHQYDYRPVTNGVNGYGWGVWPNPKAAATSDVYGYNYITGEGLDKERTQIQVPTIITEHESAQSFYPRSTYLYDDAKRKWWNKLGYTYNDAFEWVEKRDILGESGMNAWKWVAEREYVMGLFIWTGWDYLGEVIPFGWPARSSSFAPIDLAGFPKDGFYFYQSQWTDTPMVHIFPHWNLEGMEGKKVTVYAFTNGDAVELFQDGKSMGRKVNKRGENFYQSWKLVYRPGELKAVSYKNGRVAATKIVRTAGTPAQIKTESRRTVMKANGQDLIYVECSILDKDGNEVPTADNLLHFEVQGPAKIAGVANGNNMGLEPFKAHQRQAFNGKCLVILQSTREAGEIKLQVNSEGLESASIKLISK